MSSQTVIVIDDSEADLLYTQIMLERCGAGFEVMVFESAADALKHFEQAWPAAGVILLDINMPQMNGWEFLDAYSRLARDRVAHAALLMLTSSPDPQDQARARSYPLVKGYIEKPLGLAQAAELRRFLPSADEPA